MEYTGLQHVLNFDTPTRSVDVQRLRSIREGEDEEEVVEEFVSAAQTSATNYSRPQFRAHIHIGAHINVHMYALSVILRVR